jgi:hypothetical protein
MYDLTQINKRGFKRGERMTKIYGCSDDLIEFEGDVRGEINAYGTNDKDQGVLLICSDGTLLEIKFGKGGMGIWEIKPIKQGLLFNKIEFCTNKEHDSYSDVAIFDNGLKWAYSASNWDKVD